jgi:hypothetical protein
VTSPAIQIRDAIVDRLSAASVSRPYGKIRKTPLPQAQPTDLPLLSVFIMSENATRDGEGYPQFETSITIGISVIRGFDDPVTLEGAIDEDINLVETALLTDPTFVKHAPDSLFESIESMKRTRLYPQDGETYFCELRLEMVFLARVVFVPVVPDDFEKMIVETKSLDTSDNTPLIWSEYDQDTD